MTRQYTKEYLAQMISGSPIPAFVIDKDHCVTHFNKACEALTGIRADDIIGTKEQWRAFYKKERPVMADFILDEASDSRIENYYRGKFKASELKEGAYEAEDFFPDLGEDGRWLFFTAVPLIGPDGSVSGVIETLQDITAAKRTSLINEAMLRISTALHKYSYLEDLLGYISSEIRLLLNTEGALVILLDKESNELYFPGIAYKNRETENRVKEVRFSPDETIAGEVIRTGESFIINEESQDLKFRERDKKLGYQTKSLVEVPIHSEDRIIGVLTGINKIGGVFNEKDLNLLKTLAGTVALAIEKTRYAEELRTAYREVRALNNAKDKAINHLSHELKTPVTILSDAVDMIEDELAVLPEDDWKPFISMTHRNLKRIIEIQEEVSDIMRDHNDKKTGLMRLLFEACCDEISLIVAKKRSGGDIVKRVKKTIEKRFLESESKAGLIDIESFVEKRIERIKKESPHRKLEMNFTKLAGRYFEIPDSVFEKIIDGLIKNAVENTPDQGKIDVLMRARGKQTLLVIRDYGVGIPEAYHTRIFEGFFPVQEMTAYTSGKVFDFNAGGRGADLLRMKIFSEKYHFRIRMESKRCRYLTDENKSCPGKISNCVYCKKRDDCLNSGGTEFTLEL